MSLRHPRESGDPGEQQERATRLDSRFRGNDKGEATIIVGRKSEAHSAIHEGAGERRNALRFSALRLLLLLPLAACGGDLGNPYARPYTWQPGHVNEANLQAMVADPRDLVTGRSVTSVPSQNAALAVARLRADRVKPLPESGLANIVVTGTPQAAPAGGPMGGP